VPGKRLSTVIAKIIIIFSKGKGTNQIDILNVKMCVLCGLVGQNLDIEKNKNIVACDSKYCLG
jgi:hypothetical protein